MHRRREPGRGRPPRGFIPAAGRTDAHQEPSRTGTLPYRGESP